MAYLIAAANGNWTDAATWDVVDATSLLDSETNNVTLTTSYVESATFTPGAITIDGIAVKIYRRDGSTGTMSVRLAQAGATVAGTEVTINVTDIPHLTSSIVGTNGWILFRFAAPVLLVAATLYTVSARTSSANQVILHRNATAANYSRMLRTTTTAAPGAGDSMFVLGEWTAAATKTDRAVTMNETAATDYGGASTTLSSLGVGVGGTLAYGTTAATAYVLRLSGVLDVWAGGTLTIGTDPLTGGTAIPRDSTAVLEFDCAADGDFGYRLWGTATFQAHGLSRTLDLDVVQCLLNTDEAIGQTVLGVDTETGWLDTDVIAIASTTRTGTEAESATLNGDAGASSITIAVGVAAAHSGSASAQTQAEVILLTRNVMVRSVSSTAMAYGTHDGAAAVAAPGATINWSWVDFRYLGAGAVAKGGVLHCVTPPTSLTARFCCFRDGERDALRCPGTSNTLSGSTITLTDCVFYNCGAATSSACLGVASCANIVFTITLTRCTCIYDSAGTGIFFELADSDSPFLLDRCRVSSGSGTFMTFTGASGSTSSVYTVSRRIVDCVVHSLGSGGAGSVVVIAGNTHLQGLVFDGCLFWRTASVDGAVLITGQVHDLVFDSCVFFGNTTYHFRDGGTVTTVLMRNCTLSSETGFTTPHAWRTTSNSHFMRWQWDNCSLGVATGTRIAHTTATFAGPTSGLRSLVFELTLVNCVIADATELDATLLADMGGHSFVVRQRSDGTTNAHSRAFPARGTIALDTVTFRTASPSEKLTPTIGATSYFKMRSSPKRIPVLAGDAVTVSCFVRKDATYNGMEPRLVMRANPALGFDDDLVLDTMTVAHSNWEQLSGTQTPVAEEDGVVECFVEVDGSAGNVYVDDWSASSA